MPSPSVALDTAPSIVTFAARVKFVLAILLALFAASAWALDPSITEFMADNEDTLSDTDGDHTDWVEIHNPNAGAFLMTGWYLTDDLTVKTKWQFPAVTINGGAYLVVFASGKDRTDAGAELHTNFSLEKSGEQLALVMPDGVTVASSFTFPQQSEDVSYGADGFLPEPTPGAANSVSTLGFVDGVAFSVTRGFYSAPQSVALTCTTPGAEIRYTTNGDTPTAATGGVYSEPLAVSATTTLRAAAFKPGWTSSKVKTHTYLFLADVVAQSPNGEVPPGFPPSGVNGQVMDYGMDPNVVNDPAWGPQLPAALTSIPTISVVTDAANLFDPATGIYVNPGRRPDGTGTGDDWERPASIELIGAPAGFQENGGLRIRGNFSRDVGNAKHGFKVVFKKEYGPSKLDFPLFGNAGPRKIDRFDLRTMQDHAWSNPYYWDANMHAVQDPFCRVLMRDLGQPWTRGFFVHLYLNGHYWGLYNIEERPVRGFAEEYLGGRDGDYDVLKVNANQNYTVGATDGNTAAWQTLFNYATQGFAGASAGNFWTIQGRTNGVDDPAKPVLLDMENFTAYMVANFYVGNHDGPISADLSNIRPNNFYVLRDRTDRHRRGFVCVTHDMERTILDIGENRHISSNVGNQLQFFNPQWLHIRLKDNPEYVVRFGDAVHRAFFNGGACSTAPCTSRFTALTNEISLAIIGESARWGDFVGEPPRTKAHWNNAVNYWLTYYFPGRSGVALQQFVVAGLYPGIGGVRLDAPVFSQHGGPGGIALTMSETNSVTGTRATFYTLDGTDPRAIGGGAAGVVYSGPVAIPAGVTTVVKARTRNVNGATTTWSALNEATFSFTGSPLRVTELMFHPRDASAAERAAGFSDADAFEFVELQNTGTAPLDLQGARFIAGIDFIFPDMTLAGGAHLVIARDKFAFALRHGFPPAGEYLGLLDNGGDHLTLVDALGATLLDFEYADDWFPGVDGEGRSLVIRDPQAASGAWQTVAGWHASYTVGGSPGFNDDALDADGDGQSNVAELAAGTNPTDITDVFRVGGISRLGDGRIVISFDAKAGRTYAVQFRDVLTAGMWQTLAAFPSQPAPGPLSATDESPPASRFYRVATPAP
jgi:Chitobiase/beta-hexosaminidase C-terminal domain/CotH kinase protein/Lamin Tail Domain